MAERIDFIFQAHTEFAEEAGFPNYEHLKRAAEQVFLSDDNATVLIVAEGVGFNPQQSAHMLARSQVVDASLALQEIYVLSDPKYKISNRQFMSDPSRYPGVSQEAQRRVLESRERAYKSLANGRSQKDNYSAADYTTLVLESLDSLQQVYPGRVAVLFEQFHPNQIILDNFGRETTDYINGNISKISQLNRSAHQYVQETHDFIRYMYDRDIRFVQHILQHQGSFTHVICERGTLHHLLPVLLRKQGISTSTLYEGDIYKKILIAPRWRRFMEIFDDLIVATRTTRQLRVTDEEARIQLFEDILYKMIVVKVGTDRPLSLEKVNQVATIVGSESDLNSEKGIFALMQRTQVAFVRAAVRRLMTIYNNEVDQIFNVPQE